MLQVCGSEGQKDQGHGGFSILESALLALLTQYLQKYWTYLHQTSAFLQGISGSCKPCISYDRDVGPSVCLSVRHTLTLCENDAS